MDLIPDVDIDSSGKFKYILVKVTDKSGDEKLIVRGYKRLEYHSDIFNEIAPPLQKHYTLKCTGGGTILADPSKKTLEVFGYSQGYGQADHSKTAELLRVKFPDYTVTVSDSGYF